MAKTARLTSAEKAAVTKTANKAARFFAGKPLKKEKLEAVLQVVGSLKQSRKPVVGREAIALWSAKVDYAIVNGDKKAIRKLLKIPSGIEMARAQQFYDSNGGCSCGGGGGGTTSGW